MNWKHDLLWSCLLIVGVAAVGCSSGSVVESTKTTTATSPSAENEGAAAPDAANVTLVALDLPGMT